MVGQLKFVGLTGGIGSGKSSVAEMIRALGIPVLDADQIARTVVLPGQPALAEIAAAWPDAIAADGTLDRKRLASHVFGERAARTKLEAITHPRIQEVAQAEARDLEQKGHRLAFYEASLLVESGRHSDFDGLVLVTANQEQQILRVMTRDRCTRADVLARMSAQLPIEDKRKYATHVIDNSGDAKATREQVLSVVAALKADAATSA